MKTQLLLKTTLPLQNLTQTLGLRFRACLPLLLVMAFSYLLMGNAWASDPTFSFDEPSDTSGITYGLKSIVQYVFYVFYLLGGIMLGVGAFKLKQGDLPGFGKMIAGGVALFFTPAIVTLLKDLANQ
jgi:hypothetical protein